MFRIIKTDLSLLCREGPDISQRHTNTVLANCGVLSGVYSYRCVQVGKQETYFRVTPSTAVTNFDLLRSKNVKLFNIFK